MEEPELGSNEPDPELIALADASARPSILRPILMIAVIIMGGWIISDWRAELEYFMSDSTPVVIGDALDFAGGGENPHRVENLPHNTYVELSGIPTQRSQADRYRFFRLVGAPIFVEEPRDDIIEDPLERELQGDVKGDVDRTMYRGAGRLLKFSEMSERYGGLRHYYRTRYNLVFCETLTPQAHEDIKRRKRDAIVAQLTAEFDDATAEERTARGLTKPPADKLVDELLADDPVCIEAWLLQDGADPKSHVWYVVMTALMALFMLVNVVLLVRWVQRFLR